MTSDAALEFRLKQMEEIVVSLLEEGVTGEEAIEGIVTGLAQEALQSLRSKGRIILKAQRHYALLDPENE